MGPKDVPQPDIALRILPECGGQSGMEGIYATGAPELVVEVSGSTLSRDLGTKLELYQRAGVLEYLTILPHAKQLIWAVSFTRPFRRA
jgi:Uma2 family endonuclease